MSVCNGDLNDLPAAGRSRNVRFGAHDVEEEVKVSSASVLEAQPFNDDTEVRIIIIYQEFSFPVS